MIIIDRGVLNEKVNNVFRCIINYSFGGGFLIRLVRDGDFYIAEFIGGIIGVIILLFCVFVKKKAEI